MRLNKRKVRYIFEGEEEKGAQGNDNEAPVVLLAGAADQSEIVVKANSDSANAASQRQPNEKSSGGGLTQKSFALKHAIKNQD